MSLMEHEKHGYTEHVGDTKFAGIVARDVYTHWNDPVWRNAFILALGDYCENQVLAHQDQLDEWIKEAHAQTVKKARRAVVKSYLVSKANTVRVDGYTRDDGTRVSGYSYLRAGKPEAVPEPGDREAMAAMTAAMIDAFNRKVDARDRAEKPRVAYHIQDRLGNTRIEVPQSGDLPNLADGEFVSQQQPLSLRTSRYDRKTGHHVVNLAQALGANAAQAGSAGAVAQHVANAGQEHDWFRRLESMSKVLFYATGEGAAGAALGGGIGRLTGNAKAGALIGGGLSAGIGAALALGEAVGQHGPEVSRVLGPSIRRYSYKYRGMTASPEQFSPVARSGRQTDSKGNKETNQQFEYKLAHALASTDYKNGGLGAIPTEQQNALMLKSGNTAPSQGFLIDAKGKVTQQAVGSADDHYVPFNLAQLNTLKGGSYVRTRVHGGPTTEDISLAMRSGADHFTTVSRHGMYTVELDPRANSKRWGYTPRAVVNRYARLLDAIKEGNVQDPEGGGTLTLNGRGYEVALQSLKAQYPFLIKNVRYSAPGEHPALEGLHAAQAKEDSGYVRPMYLKPAEAVSGFHDTLLNPGGRGPQSFDKLEGYRSLKATRMRMEAAHAAEEKRQQQTQQAAVTQFQRTGGVVPINVAQRNPVEANRAEAAATDPGRVVRSYERPPLREAEWSENHHAEQMEHAYQILKAHEQLVGPDVDDAVKDWLGTFADARAGEIPAMERLENVRRNEGSDREDLLDAITEASDHLPDDSGLITHVGAFERGLSSEGPYVEEKMGGPRLETIEDVEADDDHEEHLAHERYKQLRKALDDKRRQTGNPNAVLNNKASMEHIVDWEEPTAEDSFYGGQSKAQWWEDPENTLNQEGEISPGLTPFEQHKQRLARAAAFEKGKDFTPARPREDAPPTKAELKAETADEMLAGLDDADIDGWSRRDDDYS